MFEEKEFSSTSDKTKWVEIMDILHMSSEESGGENTIVTHPLPWLTEEVKLFIKKSLDDAMQICRNDTTGQASVENKSSWGSIIEARDRPNGSLLTELYSIIAIQNSTSNH